MSPRLPYHDDIPRPRSTAWPGRSVQAFFVFIVREIVAIRISFVIPTLDQSGAERQLSQLACGLHAQGQAVGVIALNRGGYYERELVAAGVPVSVLGKRFRFDPLTFVRLRRSLRRFQPDIVQSFLFSANAYVRLPGVVPATAKVIVSERCVDSWKSGWQKAVDRWLKDRMHRMTANSRAVANFYQQTAGVDASDVTVIANGIKMPTKESSIGRSHPDKAIPSVSTSSAGGDVDLRAEFGLSPQTRLVGFVGRLAAQKCLRDLIWAFHLLFQSLDEPAALMLVGDGPERDDLAQFAQSVGCRDRVFFTGHRSDANILLRQLDAFCLPSSFEGMSNSLMEAMAAGVPVVVSDIAANVELVQHEHTGLVVPCGDSVAIGKALRKILTNAELADSLQMKAAAKMRDEHNVAQMVDRYQQLYAELLNA